MCVMVCVCMCVCVESCEGTKWGSVICEGMCVEGFESLLNVGARPRLVLYYRKHRNGEKIKCSTNPLKMQRMSLDLHMGFNVCFSSECLQKIKRLHKSINNDIWI